ncbi:MAG TPA: glutamine--fructose-6-phosphate transaminase (isomerizing), partial [Actinomycetota bacterium]|nr:glutamine--fructose-6-phosphate transaminase (isomerizing) [Actinomycetota bacterium]
HTRWATHGGPTDQNAHPHRDCSGRIALIHNGIIENFLELREKLEQNGHTFASETDTEVIAHLIESEYNGDLTAAVRAALSGVEGAFSVAVVASDQPGLIVAAKRTSPLIVGRNEHATFLASDPTALLKHTRDMVHILDDQLVEIRRDGFEITTLQGAPAQGNPIHVDWDLEAAEKSGFDTFMLKEIYEQPNAIRDCLRGRISAEGRIAMDELRMSEEEVRAIDKVFVVACGSAYHAGLVAKYAIEHWTRLPVEIDIASEFRYRDPVLDRQTLVIAVSQSGETIDTLEAVKFAREQRAKVMAVVNVVGSSVAREADAVLYTRAGPEVAVASTKAFTAQVVGLKLLALFLAEIRATMWPSESRAIVEDLNRLPDLVAKVLELHPQVKEIAAEIRDAPNVFFVGRHTGYPAALEGALKLKEISYVHAEGFAAGELKHGPIALLEQNVPVVAVATQCHVYQKTLSNIQEVKARGAFVVAICSEGSRDEVARHADRVLEVPLVHELLSPALVSVPMQ